MSESGEAATGGAGAARLDSEAGDGLLLLRGFGHWTLDGIGALDARARALAPEPGCAHVRIDLAGVERLDTAGAWIVARTVREMSARGFEVTIEGASAVQLGLIDKIGASAAPVAPPRAGNAAINEIARLGGATVGALAEARDLVGFFGRCIVALLRTLANPRRLRLTALTHHMERAGLDAIPIVFLLSLLIGLVLAQQGAFQLQNFGATEFTVDLLGISVLREIGVLITAIIVAGRSGSAFTAQIGTMKVNQEVDAMRTIGLDPMEVLVLPRIIALVLVLPLLVFFGDMVALLGGGLFTVFALDMSLTQSMARLHAAINLQTFMIGMSKAPVFAFLIAMVGCFEGLKVSGSAESVGRLTTEAVVISIFLVIVADAGFAVLYSALGI